MTSSSMLVPLLCTILACTCCLLVASEPESLHLSYYIQEIRYGPNRTLLAAAGTGQGNVAEIGWGSFLVFEQALKAGPTADSKLLGTITGTATITTKGGFATGGLKLSAEHIFNEASEYNGSSLTLTGTFGFPPQGWEQIVPGGTGYFRGYRGYAFGENNRRNHRASPVCLEVGHLPLQMYMQLRNRT
jgi:hypothetical protein